MASAMTEPTERSMPAVRMTTNMPERQQRGKAFCLTMLVRFVRLRKYVGLQDRSERPAPSTSDDER